MLTLTPKALMTKKTLAFSRGIDLFRDRLDPEVPSQVISLFLTIAKNEGATLTTLSTRSGQTMASTSRNAVILSAWRRYQVPGYDLVTIDINPENRRERVVNLTRKGLALLKDLEEIL